MFIIISLSSSRHVSSSCMYNSMYHLMACIITSICMYHVMHYHKVCQHFIIEYKGTSSSYESQHHTSVCTSTYHCIHCLYNICTLPHIHTSYIDILLFTLVHTLSLDCAENRDNPRIKKAQTSNSDSVDGFRLRLY